MLLMVLYIRKYRWIPSYNAGIMLSVSQGTVINSCTCCLAILHLALNWLLKSTAIKPTVMELIETILLVVGQLGPDTVFLCRLVFGWYQVWLVQLSLPGVCKPTEPDWYLTYRRYPLQSLSLMDNVCIWSVGSVDFVTEIQPSVLPAAPNFFRAPGLVNFRSNIPLCSNRLITSWTKL